MASAAVGTFGLIMLVVTTLFYTFCSWKMCEKAGFPAPLGLIAIIPGLGIFIVILILAFANWPRQPGSGVNLNTFN
jgi:hypothetical protein